MAVIDELVVKLGLDPKDFNDGQRKALESFKGTVDGFQKQGRAAEDSAKSLTDYMSGARTQALSLFAVFTGATGLVDFAQHAIRSAASVEMLSHSTGASVGEISKLQGLMKIFGGDAEQASAQVITLADAVSGLKIGQVSPLITLLRGLQANGHVTIDADHGPIAMLDSIAENLKNIRDSGHADVAGNIGRQLGLSPALFEALINGADRFNQELTKVRGTTEAEAKAALDLQTQWNETTAAVENFGKQAVLALTGSVLKETKTAIGDLLHIDITPGGLADKIGNYSQGKGFVSSAPAAESDSAAPTGRFSSQAQKEAFIRSEAAKRGVDPNVAMAVARSEGFNSFSGDNGTSGGAFQLHVTPGGRGRAVGDEFRSKTGLDPLDPANEARTIQFALDNAKANGWSAYHGAARTGIRDWQGIDRAGGAGNSNVTTISVTGPITISVPPGADPKAYASEFRAMLNRQALAAQANRGQN
jgi:hypothetical protein